MSLFNKIANGIDVDDVWYVGDSIICRTEELFDSFANVLSCLGIRFITGYYDPEEDNRDGVSDEYTGCWYITEE